MVFLRPGRSQGATQLGVKINLRDFEEADKALLQIDLELRTKVVVNAVREAGKLYKKALTDALQNKLNSELTDTRDKQSKKVRESRPEHHLYETVVIKLGPYGQSEVAVVGPSWPGGNLVNLYVSEHMRPLWGKRGNEMRSLPIAFDEAARIAHELQPVMSQKFVDSIKTGSAQVLARLAKNKA